MLLRRALNLRLAGQAVAIKVSANLVVQLVADLESPDGRPFDWQQVAEFAIYGLLGSQVGNIVQFQLEDWFPGRTADLEPPPEPVELESITDDKQLQPGAGAAEDGHDAPPVTAATAATATTTASTEPGQHWTGVDADMSWRNLIIKLVLDQTIGLVISGSIFLTCTNIARVPHLWVVLQVIRERLWSLIRAGWHIWPLVAIVNFLWVPVRSRVLVAVCVGFGWSIFLSIFAMRK